jgi:hypothetical protein
MRRPIQGATSLQQVEGPHPAVVDERVRGQVEPEGPVLLVDLVVDLVEDLDASAQRAGDQAREAEDPGVVVEADRDEQRALAGERARAVEEILADLLGVPGRAQHVVEPDDE